MQSHETQEYSLHCFPHCYDISLLMFFFQFCIILCYLGLMSIVLIICALPFMTGKGYYIFQTFDDWSGSLPLVVIALFQCIAVAWVYGNDKYVVVVSSNVSSNHKILVSFLLLCVLLYHTCAQGSPEGVGGGNLGNLPQALEGGYYKSIKLPCFTFFVGRGAPKGNFAPHPQMVWAGQ